MLSTKPRSLAQRRWLAHLAVHLTGSMIDLLAGSRDSGFSSKMILGYATGMGGNCFEYWLWTRVLHGRLAYNPTLHHSLPVTVFRWLFQKGGLTVGLYCYFEAIGVGFGNRTTEDASAWLTANSTIITHFTLSAMLALTVLADVRTSLSAVLRGMAPLHVNVGLAFLCIASLISLTIFAGREFSAANQEPLYSASYAVVLVLWVVIFGVVSAGHMSQDKRRARSRTSELSVVSTVPSVGGHRDKSCEDVTGPKRASFSALSGGAALTTGL